MCDPDLKTYDTIKKRELLDGQNNQWVEREEKERVTWGEYYRKYNIYA
jgi:hypothetical protein